MCDCIETANKHLAEFNTKIELPMWTSSGKLTPFVLTTKINEKKRGKPQMIFASCCPFCGEKYAEPEHSPQVRRDET
jgi:hypothetical protein